MKRVLIFYVVFIIKAVDGWEKLDFVSSKQNSNEKVDSKKFAQQIKSEKISRKERCGSGENKYKNARRKKNTLIERKSLRINNFIQFMIIIHLLASRIT